MCSGAVRCWTHGFAIYAVSLLLSEKRQTLVNIIKLKPVVPPKRAIIKVRTNEKNKRKKTLVMDSLCQESITLLPV